MIRNSMLRLTGALLPLVAAAQVAGAQALPSASSLVPKHAAAVGGPAYLGAKAVVTKGGMSMHVTNLTTTGLWRLMER